jgi:hypothetical protein
MDDPGGPAPRDAALPETHGGDTHLVSGRVPDPNAFFNGKLPPSASKNFIDGPAAASARHRVQYDCGSTLGNPRACLVELPNELLVHIFKLADDPHDRSSLTCLSRTSKKLKVLADEVLFKSIKIRDGLFFFKILATLKNNTDLARSIRSMALEFADNLEDRRIELTKLLDIVPNIRNLTITMFGTYCDSLSDRSLRVMKHNLCDYPTLRELNISISISSKAFRNFLSLPLLETLNCYLLEDVPSPDPWEPLVPKSKVQHLEIFGLDNLGMISQALSSIESLKHLGLHHWASGYMIEPVSWKTVEQGLILHQGSLGSLEMVHNGSVDFRSCGTFQDFSKLGALTLSLDYGGHEQPDKPSLRGMLPEGLHKLTILMWPSWTVEEMADCYYKEVLGLKEHSHLKFVKIDLHSKPSVSNTELRLSTVVETLQKSGVGVEVWKEGTEKMTPVISSLQDWEDQSDSEDSEEDDMWEIVPFDHEHNDTSSGADSDED